MAVHRMGDLIIITTIARTDYTHDCLAIHNISIVEAVPDGIVTNH